MRAGSGPRGRSGPPSSRPRGPRVAAPPRRPYDPGDTGTVQADRRPWFPARRRPMSSQAGNDVPSDRPQVPGGTRTQDAGALAGIDRLRANLTDVYARIAGARARSPRAAPRVTLVVVTKAAPSEALHLLRAIGEKDIGENRVQDAAARRESAPVGLTWHGIGHLQTNKARRAVQTFDVFHALDSPHLADAVDAAVEKGDVPGRRWPVYAQVNAARDPKKGGVAPEDAIRFLTDLRARERLHVVGLMAMAKEEDEGEAARPCFRVLREVRDEATRRGLGPEGGLGLSMGMSGDYEAAVEEGATVVRVGRAIWSGVFSGARPLHEGPAPTAATVRTAVRTDDAGGANAPAPNSPVAGHAPRRTVG